jgi:hypothetical protein
MSQLLQVTGNLVAVGIALASLPEAFATDNGSPGYQLMNESEIAAHTATMQVLQGTAREDYRDAQYERLKQRALDHGFLMPDIPPWRSRSTAAADAGQADASSASPNHDAAVAAAERHAMMRSKLDARRAATQHAIGADAEGTPAPSVGIGAESDDSPQHKAQVTAAGETDANIPQAATTVVEQDPPVNGNTADGATRSANLSTAASGNGQPDAIPGSAASETTASRPVQGEALTATQARTPPAPPTLPPPPALPPAYQPGSEPGMGEQALPGPAAERPAVTANASAEAMRAHQDAMRARFDEYMKERQAQLDADMRRQREQQAELERQRIEAPRYPVQPYPYPAMPAYGPRYPAAFPGYREPYWQQR